MTRLIGIRCKPSNGLSRDVLIARILLGNVSMAYVCPAEWNQLQLKIECFVLVPCRWGEVGCGSRPNDRSAMARGGVAEHFSRNVSVTTPGNYEKTRQRFRVLCFGALSRGSHPFSFRTRKLSLVEPMVLAREE